MKHLFGAVPTSAKWLASIIGAVTLSVSGTTLAQEGASVEIDPVIFNVYLVSRIQAPANQATQQQIDSVRSELTDLYLLSDQPSAAELKNRPAIKAQLELQTRAILAQAVAADFIANNQATDAEMQALYDQQVSQSPPMEYKARHILLESQGEAVEVVAQLEAGADFAELAKEKSTGPTGPTGGDLGWFPPDRMVGEFSQAVLALEDDAFTTEPVQTQFGWHVILREGSRESTPPPFDSVRDVLKQNVEGKKLQDYLASLRN
jgi:peptidyl-prolyl cis-trans isomerase C